MKRKPDLGSITSCTMPSDDERSNTKAKYFCSTCWKVFVDEDICLEHMLGHVADSNRNDSTETSRDGVGDCHGSGMHKTDDKNYDFDYSSHLYTENQSSGVCQGNSKTQSDVVIKEGDDQASVAEPFVGNTRNGTNGFECKKAKVHKTAGKKMYVCEKCDKQFTLRYRYIVHSKIHNDDRAYQCEICNKRFIEKTNLTTHMRYHTKSDLLYCDICKREFIKKSALAKHMEVHTDDRPYKCTYCASSFKREQHLVRHQSKHSVSRPRPFRCDKCDIAYLDSLGLSRHIRSYHNEKRDVVQTNFKTRDRKAVIVDYHSVGSQLESTMFEPVESVNRATASTLLELAGGSPQPTLPPPPGKASVPTSSGSVKIRSISGLPPTSSSSVEPEISIIDGSTLCKIMTLAEDNALSNVSEVPLALPLETRNSNIVSADSSEVLLALPCAAQGSTVLTADPSEVPLTLPLEGQSSFVMIAESCVVPSSTTLPLATSRSTDSSEITLALPLEAQNYFVMPADSSEVLSSITLPLATRRSTVIKAEPFKLPLTLPLEGQSSFMMTADSSEVPLTVPVEAQSSFIMTADPSEEGISFKNDRTGLVSLQTGVHSSSAMPHLDTSIPLSSNMSINQTELVCVENVQSDVRETYYIEIRPPQVSNTSTNTVVNGSFSDVFKRLPPINVVRKRKSTTNFPQQVQVKQKRCEVPHKLWTYM